MDLKIKAKFKGTDVTVISGFDPVLHRFWTIVEPDDETNEHADEESGMIYSNLSDCDATDAVTSNNCNYFKKKLREIGVSDLGDFFARVEAAND